MAMKNICMVLALLPAAGLLGCAQKSQSAQPAVNVAEMESAIRATDAQWLATVKTRDAEKAASFWSDDATFFPRTPRP